MTLKAWQVDAMAWERMNAPDPYSQALMEAAPEMGKVIKSLDEVIGHLVNASAELSETPVQAKVDSFIETLEDIQCDLNGMRVRWERGERE